MEQITPTEAIEQARKLCENLGGDTQKVQVILAVARFLLGADKKQDEAPRASS